VEARMFIFGVCMNVAYVIDDLHMNLSSLTAISSKLSFELHKYIALHVLSIADTAYTVA
jgi:hypothetical protein